MCGGRRGGGGGFGGVGGVRLKAGGRGGGGRCGGISTTNGGTMAVWTSDAKKSRRDRAVRVPALPWLRKTMVPRNGYLARANKRGDGSWLARFFIGPDDESVRGFRRATSGSGRKEGMARSDGLSSCLSLASLTEHTCHLGIIGARIMFVHGVTRVIREFAFMIDCSILKLVGSLIDLPPASSSFSSPPPFFFSPTPRLNS